MSQLWAWAPLICGVVGLVMGAVLRDRWLMRPYEVYRLVMSRRAILRMLETADNPSAAELDLLRAQAAAQSELSELIVGFDVGAQRSAPASRSMLVLKVGKTDEGIEIYAEPRFPRVASRRVVATDAVNSRVHAGCWPAPVVAATDSASAQRASTSASAAAPRAGGAMRPFVDGAGYAFSFGRMPRRPARSVDGGVNSFEAASRLPTPPRHR